MSLIRELQEKHLDEVIEIISLTLRECVAPSDEDHGFIMGHIRNDMDWWRNNREKCIALVYEERSAKLVGIIQIIEYKNMRHLFVLPEFHGKGIASSLVSVALEKCRNMVNSGVIKLNSSSFAASFYRKYGFVQTGEGKPLSGGCIPFEYRF